ncbi:Cytochrome P450 [Melia azedarach]|uniref:Cytochrome P450 n=1 Tax=Melia azedarach TaxID=155640 RepID=A0ACC1XHD4_MELAZ|nr:Cytochrome P450 [Melia azedarach]
MPFRHLQNKPQKLPTFTTEASSYRQSPSIKSLPHRSLHSMAQRHGPLILLHLGLAPTLLVSSADCAKEIFKTHDIIFANRPDSSIPRRLLYDYKDVSLAPYGEYWRQMRSICVLQLLSLKRVQSFRFIRQEEINLMIEKINQSYSSSSTIDLSEVFPSLTNDIVCRVAFGRRYAECEDRIVDDHMKRQSEGVDISEDQKDIVDVLLQIQKESVTNSISLSRESIKAVVLDMFAAGTDTIHISLEWTMTELIRHPQVMKEAQDEIRRIVGSKPDITEDDLENQLKMSRFKGRDPKSWKEPEEFRPERFLNSSIDFKGHDFRFIPFGEGRRGCPGATFALVIIELVLASLLRKFDWALPGETRAEDMDVTESWGLSVHRKLPLVVVATPY